MIKIIQGKEKNLLRHHPWVFTGAIDPATLPSSACIDKVCTSDGKFIAWGSYDPESHIVLRLLSWDEKCEPDASWWRLQVRASIVRRKSFFEDKASGTNVFRLIHGEADFLPGVAADVYGRIVRIVISARVAFMMRFQIVGAVEETLHPDMIILNTDSQFCGLEHLKEVTEYYKGGEQFTPQDRLDEIRIREDGILYGLIPGSGQKSGFFCDQRENRKRVELYAKGRTVLDMCSYTGAFTLHALRGGALSVDAYDASQDAVHRLLSNVNLNEENGTIPAGSREHVTAAKGDMFDVLRGIPCGKYDMIVLDPPKLAKTAKQLEEAMKGYKDINRLAMEKIADGGILVTCSCSGALSREQFRTVIAWAAKDAGVEVQVLETLGQAQDHPIRLSFPESEYLKVFILRVIK